MYPNLLHCNLAWVQWAVIVTWTAQAVRGDWASLQSVWGWLPTANVPTRQFQTSRGNSAQPATLELTVALETPWAVKQSITDLQAAEVGTKQAGSSDWNWKCECSLPAAELPLSWVAVQSASRVRGREMGMAPVCTELTGPWKAFCKYKA